MTAVESATLTYRYERPPLTSNQRAHWRTRQRWSKVLRVETAAKARAAGLTGLGRCRVTLTWYVTTRHRRDADNVVPTLKAMCDGLVDADVVPDDTPELMDKLMPRLEYEPAGTARLVLEVSRLDGPAASE